MLQSCARRAWSCARFGPPHATRRKRPRGNPIANARRADPEGVWRLGRQVVMQLLSASRVSAEELDEMQRLIEQASGRANRDELGTLLSSEEVTAGLGVGCTRRGSCPAPWCCPCSCSPARRSANLRHLVACAGVAMDARVAGGDYGVVSGRVGPESRAAMLPPAVAPVGERAGTAAAWRRLRAKRRPAR